MAKFAVYFIPPADSAFYQHGTDILGYDVRAGKFLEPDNATRAALPEFDPRWVQRPQTYGFHVTVGYTLYFELDRLPDIELEMEKAIQCFVGKDDLILTPDPHERVQLWNDEVLVLNYTPTPTLQMLHTLLVARVNPLGITSNIAQHYAQRDTGNLDAVAVERVRQYYSPYVFDNWKPHFTLMQPYSGEKLDAMRPVLDSLFDKEAIAVHSIALLLMDDAENSYRLHREFML